MVASVDGNSLGLGNSSLNTLDLQRGDAATGRNGEAVYVNAATGNLVVQHLDELLVGLGTDLPVLRTYNSQAQVDGDNDDDWRIGLSRRLVDLDGDVNRAGSAITRIDGDGARARYRYDASRGLYLNTDGAGAYDTLAYDGIARLWAWTDGDSGVRETYQQDAATGHRQLIRQQDADGNSVLFSYSVNGLLQKVASANSQGTTLNQVELVYDTLPGKTANLLFVRSFAWDAATGANLSSTRVHYSYDARQRLASVSVDLTPDDNSIADGHVYLTRYSYDGDSNRLRRISQSDGSQIDITWKQVDDEQRVASLVNAQGELTRYDYDSKSRVTTVTDPMGQITKYQYDRMGHLVQTLHPTVAVYGSTSATRLRFVGYKALTENIRYDEAGRAITHTDGNGDTQVTGYDLHGNVSMQRLAMGQTTRYQYDAQGRMVTLQDANGNSATWRYDAFGLLQEHRDLGGAVVNYRYDQARQLLEQTSSRGQHLRFGYDAAGQQISRFDLSLNQQTDSAWDAAGNKTLERMQQAGVLYQDSALSYDERGRLVQVDERSDGQVSVQIGYDGANNRSFVHTRVHAAGVNQDEIRWFAYDSMNRQTLVNAAHPAGDLGSKGRRISYDLAGRRTSETWNGSSGEVTQGYRYDALNRLIATERDGIEIERRTYDGAGRIVQQGVSGLDEGLLDAMNQGLPETDHISGEVQITRYNANGWTESQRVTGADGSAKYETDYSNGYDAVGNLLRYTVANHGDSEYTNTFVNQYEARDDYLLVRTDASSTEFEPGYNTRNYDANGKLIAINDATKDANNRSYVNNAQGQAIWALQSGNVQRQLLANGQLLGRYGVAVDPYQARDDEGNLRFAAMADLDFSFAAVNGRNPTSPGSYSVQPGDSLKSISQQVYGDAGYWYLLADANGLQADSTLKASQNLRLPSAQLTQHNQQDSFKPYSADTLIGDTTPNMSPPEQDEGCGGLLQIVIIIVAVVVTIYTAGAAAGAMGVTGASAGAAGAGAAAGGAASTFTLGAAVLGGSAVGSAGAIMTAAAIGGAVGSIASQLTGMALGVQSGFSWTGVALGALGAGMTAGVGISGLSVGTNPMAVAGRAVLSNAATQGIAVLTGLQPSFSWTNVAAAGVGAGVGSFMNAQLDGWQVEGLGNFGSAVMRGVVSGFVAGTATALLNGGRITITQIATDAFGNALANSLVEHMQITQIAQAAVAPKAEPTSAAEVVAQTELGSGLQVSQTQIAAWGPRFPSQSDYSFEKPDYSLLAPGQSVRLATMIGEAAPQRTVQDWNPDGTWNEATGPMPVGVPLAQLTLKDALPPIEPQGRYVGGATQAASTGWREAMNPNNSLGERLIYGGLSLVATPVAAVESLLYAPLNVAPAAHEFGQVAARAYLQTDPAQRNVDILRGASLGAEAFTSAGAWLSGPRPQVGYTQSSAELYAIRTTYADAANNYGASSSIDGTRLNMQLAAEQAAGAQMPTQIGGYTAHALQQIAGRDGGIGVSKSALLNAWTNPVKIDYVPSKFGPTFRLTGNNASIVVNADGKVVTGWAKSSTGTGQ